VAVRARDRILAVTRGLSGRPVFDDPPAPPYQSAEIHPSVFTPRQCERIVALGTSLDTGRAGLEATDGTEVSDVDLRRSSTSWIAPHDGWWIYDKLARAAERANRRYRLDLSGFSEDLQFTTYAEPGAFYTWHQDGLDTSVAHRKLSLVVQLSDPGEYTGAELQFFDVVEDLTGGDLDEFTAATKPQGTVIAFPSFEYHRVLPVRSGVRHSLVAWVSGPPFR